MSRERSKKPAKYYVQCGRAREAVRFAMHDGPPRGREHLYFSGRVETDIGRRSYKVKKKAPKFILPVSVNNLGPASSAKVQRDCLSMRFRCSTLQMNMHRQCFFCLKPFGLFESYPSEGLCKTIHTSIGIMERIDGGVVTF